MARIKLLEIAIGAKIKAWEVIGAPYRDGKVTRAMCRCECGREKAVNLYNAIHGASNNCGGCESLSVKAGTVFNRFTTCDAPYTDDGRTLVECECVCGTKKVVEVDLLQSGVVKSCGCWRREALASRTRSHGDAARGATTRLYRIWSIMHARCEQPSQGQTYLDYGGRGIKVCEAWSDYAVFKEWALANGYADNLSIERNNVDGDYEPGNCKWIPMPKQARNRRDAVKVTAFGETKSIHDWAGDPRAKAGAGAMRQRVRTLKWTDGEKIVTTPSPRRRTS